MDQPFAVNGHRADWAAAALDAFRDRVGLEGEEPSLILQDLLTDLMHWSARTSVDFGAAMQKARSVYAEECREENEEVKEWSL
ncbi:MAG: hypothetical protein ACK4FJ_18510 [Ferrovibrio sp.]|uniref:hypothetical protein n=1 Tax=Ferrovibrio sp. TaxID=1917215 RepID=UPI00391D3F27